MRDEKWFAMLRGSDQVPDETREKRRKENVNENENIVKTFRKVPAQPLLKNA